MKSIQQMMGKQSVKVLKKFICKTCQHPVIQKEMVIPFGPYRGRKVAVHEGCKCKDMEIVRKVLQTNKQQKQKKLAKLFQGHSLINTSLQRAAFETFQVRTDSLKKVKEDMIQYAKDFHPETSTNLLFVGGFGVGKSHLAVAITKELMKQGYSCLFLSVPKLLTKIRQTYSGTTNFNEAMILELIESVDLFVLDDLGTEYTNKKKSDDNWTHTKLFEVLDSRQGKPTIYTTNLNGEQLKKKVNGRNLSRIMDGTEVVHMNGVDYRMRGRVHYEKGN